MTEINLFMWHTADVKIAEKPAMKMVLTRAVAFGCVVISL